MLFVNMYKKNVILDSERERESFEAEVIMQEDIISVSLASLNDGEFR